MFAIDIKLVTCFFSVMLFMIFFKKTNKLCVLYVCVYLMAVAWLLGGWLCPMSTDSRFLFTENVQFSYVSLRCTSSGQRMRSRHGRKAGEEDGSSITAEFELDVNLEEVTGWSLCASSLPACNLCLLLPIFFSAAACSSLNKPNC